VIGHDVGHDLDSASAQIGLEAVSGILTAINNAGIRLVVTDLVKGRRPVVGVTQGLLLVAGRPSSA
jgi:hypothetical protein